MTGSVAIPHDPPSMDDPNCPLCEVSWPCAERKRQRIQKRAIENYLKSDLYAPVRGHVDIDGVEAIRWLSPLAWFADITYGEKGLVVVIHSYDGNHRSDDATAEWVDRWLP